MRRLRLDNPEKAAETQRKYREAHPERRSDSLRKWRAANSEKVREYGKAYRELNREAMYRNRDLYWERHPEKLAESRRRRGQRRIKSGKSRMADRARRHGKDWQAAYAEMWEDQGGCCYLCGDPLQADGPHSVVIDHDHTCCPQRRSCSLCRRGLACGRCNKLVGLADEDPARLFRIAAALEAAAAKVAARLAEQPQQTAML